MRAKIKGWLKDRATIRAVALLTFAAFFFAASSVAIRMITQSFSFNLGLGAAVRDVGAALVLGIATLLYRPAKSVVSSDFTTWWIGLSKGLNSVCLVLAFSLGPASLAVILVKLNIIWVFLGLAVFYRDEISMKRFLGALLAFIGAGYAVIGPALNSGGIAWNSIPLLAVVFGVLSGIWSAAYRIPLNKHSSVRGTRDTGAVLRITFIFVLIGSIVGFSGAPALGGGIDLWAVLLMAVVGLTMVAPAYFLYTLGQKDHSSLVASVVPSLMIPFTAVLEWLLIGEGLGLPIFIGGGLVMAGIFLVARH